MAGRGLTDAQIRDRIRAGVWREERSLTPRGAGRETPAHYKIKPFKRDGETLYDLLQDGDWLETFETTEAAEAEMEHRQAFDSTLGGS
jgi:hypothetical protein